MSSNSKDSPNTNDVVSASLTYIWAALLAVLIAVALVPMAAVFEIRITPDTFGSPEARTVALLFVGVGTALVLTLGPSLRELALRHALNNLAAYKKYPDIAQKSTEREAGLLSQVYAAREEVERMRLDIEGVLAYHELTTKVAAEIAEIREEFLYIRALLAKMNERQPLKQVPPDDARLLADVNRGIESLARRIEVLDMMLKTRSYWHSW